MGVTESRIAGEISSCLECAKLCEKKKLLHLGVPATALLLFAGNISEDWSPLFPTTNHSSRDGDHLEPDRKKVCRAMFGSIESLVERELEFCADKTMGAHAPYPDFHVTRKKQCIEPFG